MCFLRPLVVLASVSLLAVPAAAQCSTLTITGSVNPGQTVTLALTGAGANDPAFAAVGEHTGSTTLNFGPLGSVTLGLAQPFALVPLGTTDANGGLAFSATVPANVAILGSHDVFVQVITVEVVTGPGMPHLNFCTSNVAMLHIGP